MDSAHLLAWDRPCYQGILIQLSSKILNLPARLCPPLLEQDEMPPALAGQPTRSLRRTIKLDAPCNSTLSVEEIMFSGISLNTQS